MAAKKILLLLDSDRYAYPLIRFLTANAKVFGWKIKVGSMFDSRIAERIRTKSYEIPLEFLEAKKMQECEQAIKRCDLVIALVQDAMLLEVADSCISYRKTMISPARLTRQMALKKTQAKDNNTLILMDCGFSPGLDHIIAKKAIDNIHSKGGKIFSFKTYSGTVLAESLEANPWGFKLTEPLADLVAWGKHNNRHLLNGRMQHVPYHRLFERGEPISIREHENMMAIPEGDSLYYRKIYELVDTHTLVKGKLARAGFERMWNILIRLGLTDSSTKIDFIGEASYYNLLDSLLPASPTSSIEERLQHYTGADAKEIENLEWLGLFDKRPLNDFSRETSPLQLLQHLLEDKFSIKTGDKDCVMMEHQLAYEFRDEHFQMTATILLKGENETDSALATVTGLMCGAAAKAVLLGTIRIKGLHIPTIREVYDPILNELEEHGIAFHVDEQRNAEPQAAVHASSGNI